MCRSLKIHNLLQDLPKCEHHLHIEGTLMPSLLFNLAQRNKITLPTTDSAYTNESTLLERYKHFTSLDDFLNFYYIGTSVLIQEQDFEDLAWAYFTRAKADGVVHAEISFDPQAHTERGVPFSTVLNGLLAACKRAEIELKMSTQIICCFMRNLPVQAALHLYDSADFRAAVAAKHIVGIGLDSSETGYPPELFMELHQRASEDGLRLTAHAGEEGPPENIKASITKLGCERIDHGIRVAEDEELMRDVAAQGVMLTVCPLSNVRLRCVENVAQMPIRRFLDGGVQFSLNSDDPAYFGGFILDNYCAVQEAFGLEVEEWKKVCLASVEGSWCNEEKKREIRKMIEDVVRTFQQ